jgi:hypothetical protein
MIYWKCRTSAGCLFMPLTAARNRTPPSQDQLDQRSPRTRPGCWVLACLVANVPKAPTVRGAIRGFGSRGIANVCLMAAQLPFGNLRHPIKMPKPHKREMRFLVGLRTIRRP